MFNKFIQLFFVKIKGSFKHFGHVLTVSFLDVRDFIFIILVKRIKFRKDVAEFLVSEIELHKSFDIMNNSENSRSYYRYRDSNNNRIRKINCHD